MGRGVIFPTFNIYIIIIILLLNEKKKQMGRGDMLGSSLLYKILDRCTGQRKLKKF